MNTYIENFITSSKFIFNKHNNNTNNNAYFQLIVSVFILTWMAIIEVVIAGGWIVKYNIISQAPFISFSALLFAVLLYCIRYNSNLALQAFSVATILCTLCLMASGTYHDFTVDGQSYNQFSILKISNNWNPFYEFNHQDNSIDLKKIDLKNISSENQNHLWYIWCLHYPKGGWILSASFLSVFGDIELGKSVNLMLLACSWLISFYVFHEIKAANKKFAIIVAFLVAFNPVSSSQLFDYCNDGQVSSLLVITALLLYCFVHSKNIFISLGIVSCIILGLNTKFSLSSYLLILFFVFFIYIIFYSRKFLKKFTLIILIGVFISIFVGINPYLTNTWRHGNPFYPLAGNGSVDVIKDHATQAFLQKNRLEKLLLSVFSKSRLEMPENNAPDLAEIDLKFPFAIYASEMKAFYKGSQVRIAGFGPLMGGAFLTVLLYTILYFRFHFRWPSADEECDWPAFVAVMGLVFCELAFPESWWARYAPQFWHINVLAVAFLLSSKQIKPVRVVGYSALTLMGINGVLIITLSFASELVKEIDFREQINSISALSNEKPVGIDVLHDSTRYRLASAHVNYFERPKSSCEMVDEIIGTGSSICIEERFKGRYLRGSEFIAKILGRSVALK